MKGGYYCYLERLTRDEKACTFKQKAVGRKKVRALSTVRASTKITCNPEPNPINFGWELDARCEAARRAVVGQRTLYHHRRWVQTADHPEICLASFRLTPRA